MDLTSYPIKKKKKKHDFTFRLFQPYVNVQLKNNDTNNTTEKKKKKMNYVMFI